MGKRSNVQGALAARGLEDPAERIPQRGIVKPGEEELAARGRTLDFAKSGPSANTQYALGQLRTISEGSNDPLDPSGKVAEAVDQRIRDKGNQDIRSIGRALKIGGNDPGSASAGERIIGNSLTDMQGERLRASLSFVSAQEARKLQATGALLEAETQAARERLGKLILGQETTAQARLVEQSVQDAVFNEQMQEAEIYFKVQPGILTGAFNAATSLDASQSSRVNRADYLQGVQTVSATASTIGDLWMMGKGIGGGGGQKGDSQGGAGQAGKV